MKTIPQLLYELEFASAHGEAPEVLAKIRFKILRRVSEDKYIELCDECGKCGKTFRFKVAHNMFWYTENQSDFPGMGICAKCFNQPTK